MKTGYLLLCLLFSASLRGAELQSFEVSGRMHTVYPMQGGTVRTNSRTFALATDGRDVLIRCTAGTADQGFDYGEFGTDGTNGFHFSKTLLKADPFSKHGLVNDAVMHIEPSPVPPRGAINYVWLLYAAQNELEGRTESFLRPRGGVWLPERMFDQERLRMLNDHLLLRAEWTFNDRRPYLLQTFVDYCDGKLASDRFSQSLIPGEFMSGRTNSRMEVLAWTNIAGLHIPLAARVITYVTGSEKSGGGLQVRFTHELLATNVVAGTRQRSFVPKPSKATSVFDYRFAEGPHRPASYLLTNGIILHTAEEVWAAAQQQ